jgi:hypothetical protein
MMLILSNMVLVSLFSPSDMFLRIRCFWVIISNFSAEKKVNIFSRLRVVIFFG